mmetsp:Transcript_90749/g.207642  ORF Transcript_90749/g.207642 Transcript_90749/m.207642 type:complete len:393 (-) Transcript_90749:1921-3099(-)
MAVAGDWSATCPRGSSGTRPGTSCAVQLGTAGWAPPPAPTPGPSRSTARSSTSSCSPPAIARSGWWRRSGLLWGGTLTSPGSWRSLPPTTTGTKPGGTVGTATGRTPGSPSSTTAQRSRAGASCTGRTTLGLPTPAPSCPCTWGQTSISARRARPTPPATARTSTGATGSSSATCQRATVGTQPRTASPGASPTASPAPSSAAPPGASASPRRTSMSSFSPPGTARSGWWPRRTRSTGPTLTLRGGCRSPRRGTAGTGRGGTTATTSERTPGFPSGTISRASRAGTSCTGRGPMADSTPPPSCRSTRGPMSSSASPSRHPSRARPLSWTAAAGGWSATSPPAAPGTRPRTSFAGPRSTAPRGTSCPPRPSRCPSTAPPLTSSFSRPGTSSSG